MGFLDKIIKKLGENQPKLLIDTDKLIDSIVLDLDKMEQRVIAISALDNEQGEKLQNEIQGFRDRLMNSNDDDIQLEVEMREFKNEFNKQLKIAEGKYMFTEMEILNKKLTNRLWGNITDEEKTENLSYYEKKLEVLIDRKTKLSGMKQQLFIRESIKAKYKLICCKLSGSYIMDRYPEQNEIKNASDEEKQIFATQFTEDMKTVQKVLDHINLKYKLEDEKFIEYNDIIKTIDRLLKDIEIKYIEDMNITEIFDDIDFMRDYMTLIRCVSVENFESEENIQYLKKTREEERQKKAEQEEQARKQQELEEKMRQKKEHYKDMTEQEIRKDIKKLDNDKYDVTKSYKDIIEYQREIAEAKGLLDTKSGMNTEDIGFVPVKAEEIGLYMMKAEDKGVAYSILYNIDDEEKDCRFVISKDKTNEIMNSVKGAIPYIGYYTAYYNGKGSGQDIIPGKYGKSFMYVFLQQKEEVTVEFSENGEAHALITECFRAKKAIKKCAKYIKEQKEKSIEHIKCSLEVPYLRPIIPILEELQNAGIEYYIPPTDEINNKANPTVKIYIDRANIKKYREKVHNKISTIEKGVVIVGEEDLDYQQIMLEGTDSELVSELSEEQK